MPDTFSFEDATSAEQQKFSFEDALPSVEDIKLSPYEQAKLKGADEGMFAGGPAAHEERMREAGDIYASIFRSPVSTQGEITPFDVMAGLGPLKAAMQNPATAPIAKVAAAPVEFAASQVSPGNVALVGLAGIPALAPFVKAGFAGMGLYGAGQAAARAQETQTPEDIANAIVAAGGAAALFGTGAIGERAKPPIIEAARTILPESAKAVEEISTAKGAEYASEISPPAEVHGPVSEPPEEGAGQVPVERGGEGIRTQAQEGIPSATPEQGRVLLEEPKPPAAIRTGGEPSVPPTPAAKIPQATIDRIKDIRTLVKDLADKGALTTSEAERYRALNQELNSLRYDVAKPLTLEKIGTEDQRQSTLPAELVLIARNDLFRSKPIYSAITDAAVGVFHGKDTAIDQIVKGNNPSISVNQLYDAFRATRDALRQKFGDTIKLYRAVGKQKEKPTTNWATTKEYAKQFGDKIISRDVPIDNVLAVNVGIGGKYHEMIVTEQKPSPVATGKAEPESARKSTEIPTQLPQWPWPNKSQWIVERLREITPQERANRSKFLGLKKPDGSWETAPSKIAEQAKKRFAEQAPKPEVPTPEEQAALQKELPGAAGQIGMGAATPGELQRSAQSPTAMKYRLIDQERQKRGLEPLAKPESVSDQATMNKAMAWLDKNPEHADILVQELLRRPRAIEDWENHILLLRKIDLREQYYRSAREAQQAYEDSKQFPERLADMQAANARTEEWNQKLSELEEASRKAGSQRGRALRALRVMANEDYSLAGLEVQRRTNQGWKPLTPEEAIRQRQQLESIADRWKKAADIIASTPEGTEKVTKAKFEQQKVRNEVNEMAGKDKRDRLNNYQRALSRTSETFNFLRALITSYDLSAVLRQGKFIALSHPLRAASSIGPMLEAWKSPEAQFRIMEKIHARPNAPLYDQSGLYIAKIGEGLSKAEEVYVSRLARKVPGVGASERSYTTFLNKLRADSFDAMANNLSREGTITLEEAKAISNFINAATGRGRYPGENVAGASGKSVQMAGELLSKVFFAPRFVASRFQIITGEPLYRGTARTRTLIAKEYARFLTGAAVVYTLGAMAGAEIESDPRSTDFGKMRFGNTRIDPMAGLIQNTVLLSRIVSGETKTQTGRIEPLTGKLKYGKRSLGDVMGTWLRSKLAPVPSMAITLRSGTNLAGQPVTAGEALAGGMAPISVQDIYAAMKENGIPAGLAFGILAIFGEGVQVYGNKAK